MSIDSTYKTRLDINLKHNKPLHSTLSERDRLPITRHSLKSPSRERYHQEQTQSRIRTLSVSAETAHEPMPEITSTQISSHKHDDKRPSELKSTSERHVYTPVERRNSIPQLHFSALIPHAFRNQKHHHKLNTKDETNANNLTGNNVNASAAIPSNHSVDTMTTKADPPFVLKSSLSPMNGSRFISSSSSERLLSQSQESISSSSFIFEENPSELRSAELFIIESHTPICVSEIYREHFFEYFHTNYYGEFDQEGPFLASLRYFSRKTPLGDVCEARSIIRTQFRNCNVSDTVDGTNENNILQVLLNKVNLPPIHSYGTIGDPKANEKIYLFDKTNDERFNCKIGVIYQRSHQTNEYDIFCNDDLPTDMLDFLEILADRIRLKDFSKYRGDLDTKDDLHGEYSYYTVYDNHEIMFNVAPLVPSTKANGQCIERKGLVGNSFVCIVFQEAGAIFSPDFISGRVTQIYITVQRIIHDEETYYKIGVWRRNDITSIVDPPGGIYKNDESFWTYFLTLLLNSVNVAIESPSLRPRVFEQRRRIKYEELRKLCHLFSLGPIPDFTQEIDNIHYQMDPRPKARSESFTSNATATTNDSSSNTNTGRTSPGTSKKKGLSRKIFGVFSSRSASISSPTIPSNHTNNDTLPLSPQPPSLPDSNMLSVRTSNLLNKETVKPTRSTKTTQAPVLPSRPLNPHTISIQPATPSFVSVNPLLSDNLTENHLLNTVSFNITPRNRSNSSPEDTVNTNKSTLSAPTIDEEDLSMSGSNDEELDDDSSEDDSSSNPPLKHD